MKDFSDIVGGFKAIREDLRSRWVDAGASGRESAERWIVINDWAYFSLLFAQLEAEVNRRCADLIRHKRGQADWAERRAWDILDHREDRIRSISFLNRVALLTDSRGPVYKRVQELYQARNRIAHGELPAETLDVAEIAKDIQDIAEQLKGVP